MTELLNGFLSGSAAWGVMLTLAAFALGTPIGRIHDAVTVQFSNVTLHHLNLIFDFFRNHCKLLTF